MTGNPFAFLDQPPALICGAGPTGLVAALWLQKLKIPFRIIDPALKPGTTTRAMVIHARTLEFYNQLDIADRVVAAGTILNGLRIYSNGVLKGEIQYKTAAIGQSKYPHILSLGQDAHEAILNEICEERNIKLERGIRLSGAVENEDGIECTLENIQTGTTETYRASYVIGCDGAHSATRKAAGLVMAGGTYANRSYVTDVTVESTGSYDSKYMNLNLSQHVFCMIIPYTKNTARIIGFVPSDKVDENGDLKDVKELQFNDIEEAVREAAPTIKITGVEWFTTYRVHHRVADGFQSTFKPKAGDPYPGRIFICGDAGHLHSPVGGQGMNTGIGDATNLAWKLAAVHQGSAPAALLETYAAERRQCAETLVKTTDTGFQLVNDQGWLGWLIRNLVVPYILTTVTKLFPSVQTKMFRTVSQIAVAYPLSLLSTNGPGIHGTIKAGDRLPWVGIAGVEGQDNLSSLQSCKWQAHVYGFVSKDLVQLLQDRGIPLTVFPWDSTGSLSVNMHTKGLGKDILYLVRPDGQVGLVCARDDTQVLSRYLDRWEVGTQTA